MAIPYPRPELERRQRALLRAIVQEFIDTAQAVSSRRIAQNYMLGIRPATVRNMMAGLEQDGYLYQPHTSAGRIPTAKAFRYFVDTLTPSPEVGMRERAQIEFHYSDRARDPAQLVRDTSRLLTSLTGHTAVATGPCFDSMTLERVELVCLRACQVTAVLVRVGSAVRDCVLETSRPYSQSELNQISDFTTSLVKGCTLDQAKARLSRALRELNGNTHPLVRDALQLGTALFASPESDAVYVQGSARVLDQPEFVERKKAQELLEALEDRAALANALGHIVDQGNPSVAIGDENADARFSDFSVVAAAYASGGVRIGNLAVIGPLRMDYRRVIALVDYTARVLSRVWN
jgi:heat-inducible transcriptional repressor